MVWLSRPRKVRKDNPDANPLFSEQRQLMLRVIRENPGISVGDLKAQMPFQWGSFYYHLDVLLDKSFVKLEVDSFDLRRRHLYPAEGSMAEMTAESPPTVLTPAAKEVALIIAANPGVDFARLVELAGIPPRTLHYHLKRLSENGLVQTESPTRYVGITPTPMLHGLLGLPEAGVKKR